MSTVSSAGERAVVARVVARLPQGAQVLVGPGDDAAVVAAPDRRVVVTTDVLVEGVHFRRDWSSAVDVGRKAAAQSLADVAAMGAVPTAIVVGLVAPADLPLEWTDGLTDGLRAECDRTGASVVGGDVTAGPLVVVAVTALGDLVGAEPVRRRAARVGDVVVVAGTLGGSARGLHLLRERAGADAGALAAHRRPCPPYPLGPALARAGATAMTDTSDGLLVDAGHLAGAGTVLDLDGAALDAVAAPGATREQVLRGGEDHALVATLPPTARVPRGCAVVGRVRAGDAPGGVLLDGEPVEGSGGWEHYR